MKATLRITVILVVFLFAVDATLALPRFASRTGAKCQSCHENPSGGGMRKAFGIQYGRETVPVPTWSNEFALDDFSNKLTDFVWVGADFRTLFFVQQNPSTTNNAFYQMQGTLYTNFRIAKKVNMYIAKGLYTRFEIFGLLNILPANGHVKVGKFIPNYGTKLDDHRTFIRDKTGFSPETGNPELTGGEVAVSPGPVTITGGFYNAEDQRGAATANNKAYLGRAESMFKVSESVNIGVGGNVFSTKDAAGLRTTLFGGFGSLSYENLTVFGEADYIKNNTVSGVNGIVTYVEADYVLTPGVDVKLAYDFYDPDKDLKSGSFSRYSVGFEFFPISGVEVRPVYRFNREDPNDVKNDEFQLLFHFYL